MKKIIVKNSSAGKIRSFFPWLYRDDLAEIPGTVESGELVRLQSQAGDFLGIGYINPLSQIPVRVLCRENRPIDADFFSERISMALTARYDIRKHTTACRLVHAEADDLPGLVVDDYAGYLCLQINAAGMERLRGQVVQALVDTLNPPGIYEKSDETVRAKEGLGTKAAILHGDVPEAVQIEENGVKFVVRLMEGQKTGFYLDQRRNRLLVSSHVRKGFHVLDLFSNTGAFGIYAALKGASVVKLVDISAAALKQAAENSRLNGLGNVQTVRADAFNYLRDAYEGGSRYDCIVLDPPSFAKNRRSKEGALRAFRQLLSASLRLLRPGGLMAVFSCAHVVTLEDLKHCAFEAARDRTARLETLEHLFQDRDHPYDLHIPNSLYLKGLLLRRKF